MRYVITCILLAISCIGFSQLTSLDSAEVKSSTIEFNGGKYNGYMLELNTSPDIVEEAIKQRFKAQGTKAKETKGFLVYRNVILPQISPSKPVDAFIKVERKSRKEKEQAVVYLIAANPGEIPEEKLKSDAKSGGISAIEKSGAFLTGLVPDIKQGVFDKDLGNQQSTVKKEEKKLAGLQEDLEDMEKKLKKLQGDIEYNKKAQERQVAEVEKAKTTLNNLMSKNPKGAQ